MMVSTFWWPYGFIDAALAVLLAWLFVWLDGQSTESVYFDVAGVVSHLVGGVTAFVVLLLDLGPSGLIAVAWSWALIGAHRYVWLPRFRLGRLVSSVPHEHLIDLREVAQVLGYRSVARLPRHDPGFPTPVSSVWGYPTWDRREVEAWARSAGRRGDGDRPGA
jgi:predicted DNA-binding transcriptional regulator AlpA